MYLKDIMTMNVVTIPSRMRRKPVIKLIPENRLPLVRRSIPKSLGDLGPLEMTEQIVHDHLFSDLGPQPILGVVRGLLIPFNRLVELHSGTFRNFPQCSEG